MPSPASLLPELDDIERLVALGGSQVDARVQAQVTLCSARLNVWRVALGNPDPAVPALGVFGGVHGLERIGAAVALAYLGETIQRLKWDALLHEQLARMRLVFMPVVNPGGIAMATRANPNGVDLMRNSPVQAEGKVSRWVGGQRMSKALPWYQGEADAAMEIEAQALCDVVHEELLPRAMSLTVDCHSGFGIQDRLWMPLAHTTKPMDLLPEYRALHDVFAGSHARQPYVFEPQSRHYLTHGDLWDHLYLHARQHHPDRVFLPLTLEMGSWLWIKKNPRQAFSRLGMFNPLIDHRQQRVLRRHTHMLDWMSRAVLGHARWLPQGAEREALRRAGLAAWYGHVAPDASEAGAGSAGEQAGERVRAVGAVGPAGAAGTDLRRGPT